MTTETILLVEDDENDAFFLQRAMHKTGMANPVRNAWDGREAIDYLRGAGKFGRRAEFPLPGLVLLDLKLPFVMGLDVLKWIRQNADSPPIVIILSSSADPADVAAAYQLGANGYLVKPVAASQLEEMVRAINDFWLLHNTPPVSSSVDSGELRTGNFWSRGSDAHKHSSGTGSLGCAAATGHHADL